MQALKMQRAKVAEQAGMAPAPHEENVLTHWVRSAADMRLQVHALAVFHLYMELSQLSFDGHLPAADVCTHPSCYDH